MGVSINKEEKTPNLGVAFNDPDHYGSIDLHFWVRQTP
jgi:hypothetical protein